MTNLLKEFPAREVAALDQGLARYLSRGLAIRADGAIVISAEDAGGYTENGDGISAETSRRLLCDCGIVPMLEDAQGQTIDVGRKTRVISPALRRALEHRDGGCQFPGCSNTRPDL